MYAGQPLTIDPDILSRGDDDIPKGSESSGHPIFFSPHVLAEICISDTGLQFDDRKPWPHAMIAGAMQPRLLEQVEDEVRALALTRR
jgi:hypothetical protein